MSNSSSHSCTWSLWTKRCPNCLSQPPNLVTVDSRSGHLGTFPSDRRPSSTPDVHRSISINLSPDFHCQTLFIYASLWVHISVLSEWAWPMMSIIGVRWRQMSGAVLIKTRFLLNVYAHSMKEYNMNNKLNVFVWSRYAGACVLIMSQCAGACVLIRSQCTGACVQSSCTLSD